MARREGRRHGAERRRGSRVARREGRRRRAERRWSSRVASDQCTAPVSARRSAPGRGRERRPPRWFGAICVVRSRRRSTRADVGCVRVCGRGAPRTRQGRLARVRGSRCSWIGQGGGCARAARRDPLASERRSQHLGQVGGIPLVPNFGPTTAHTFLAAARIFGVRLRALAWNLSP